MNRIRSVLLAALLGLGIGPVYAQEKGPDDWKYALGIYLWGTGIEGTSGVGPVNAPISITFSDALDNLSSALMLHFEAEKGQWGMLANLMHISLDPESTLPSGATLNIDLKNNIVDVAGTYKTSPTGPFQLLFGLRFTEVKLEGSIPAGPSGTIVDENWVDAFIGGRVVAPFANNWRFIGRADVGTGDSDLTWNVMASVDYRFSNRVSGLLGYRWLDYDYESGQGPNRFAYDVRYEGPLGAVIFYW